MSFLQDRQARRYLFTVSWVCALAVILGALFCMAQARAAERLLLTREQQVADALLGSAVPPEVVAAAISNDADSGRGAALLSRMGRTAHTPPHLLPALRAFAVQTVVGLLAGVALCAAALLFAALRFLRGWERRCQNAEQAVRRFASGDFGTHLPRVEEGAFARLCAAVDGLASALQSKGEAEHRAKEFLKDAISDISHQLKTPLAALRMYQEIIQGDAGDEAVVAAFSGKMAGALARMEGLIQALLKITRLDAGGIVFEKARADLRSLAKRATAELVTRAAREHKALALRGDPAAWLLCDLDWTAEAVGNLVKNALDHTATGGRVEVSWERTAAVTRITVTDDGCGIAPEDIHHIFKRFYRSSHSLDTQGVGLGLPLAKAIIEGQGGALCVWSAPGMGARFTASFLTEP
ncbi:HAMP domain-containing histidine kinase [Intestinibacillus massiliensis]|nr:HAMP domain-containing histidine kinase [Intestinibacillus massiliensis]